MDRSLISGFITDNQKLYCLVKVLFIDKSRIFAGAEYSLSSLIEGLKSLSVNTLICSDYPLKHHDGFKGRNFLIIYRNNSLKWWMGTDFSLKSPRGSDFLKRIIFGIQLFLIIKNLKVKLIHINLLRNTDRIDIILSKLAGCKVIGHVRSLQCQAKIHRSTLNSCNRIICTSDFVLSEIDATGCRTPALRIYNPIDVSAYSAEGLNLDELRLKYGLPKQSYVISSVAILDPRKGHDTAVQAFNKVSREISNSILIIAGGISGENNEKVRLMELVQNLNLGDKVVFLGHTNSINEVYAISDIILTLSKDGEAFGRVPLEAAAARKVVIATGIGATPEIVKQNVTGLLVNTEDHIEVAEGIIKLISDEDLRHSLSENAFKNVKQNFLVHKHVDGVLGIYDSLMQ